MTKKKRSLKMFGRVQIRFVLIPILVSACLLACVFGTIFCISLRSAYSSAQNSINRALDIPNKTTASPVAPEEMRCLLAIVKNDGTIELDRFDFYEGPASNKIVEGAFATVKQDKKSFMIDDMHFLVNMREMTTHDDYSAVYAIFDFTGYYNTLRTLSITLVTVYFVTVFVIGLISYLMSHSAVSPIREAFEKQQELIANASHELKTPLTIVSTNLDLVRSDENGSVENNKKWLDNASYQLSRMNSLILQMLELSALEADSHEQTIADFNLSELCQGILLTFEATSYEKQIINESEIEENFIYACDKQELEKLITILVDNANKYTPTGGKISFVLETLGRNVCIKVTNTGEGISPEDVENVFERFYKTDSSHSENGNSFGLGLSIAKSISNLLGGDLFCSSKQGEWTCFEIKLPLNTRTKSMSKKFKNIAHKS